MIATRTLSVLSATSIVAAIALATLLPPTTSLAQLVGTYDSRLLVSVHDFVAAHLSVWTWNNLALPILMRPCWLPLACIGIVLAGGAMTAASRSGVPRSHRRRS